VVIITPEDEVTPTATTEIIPSPTEVIPTPTEVIPTPTDVIIPQGQGADVGSKLGFAQVQQDDCETPSADDGSGDPDDGDDTGGDTAGDGSSVTGLPSTGSGASETMAAVWFVVATGAGLLLCAAAWVSLRKRTAA
jgi:hypothetical protein